mmetsp:Transcript_6850/g.16556  ORF Transcript_6850/g.16556 Transcript_6850/m.16556 type:complete len:201 (-) Transcript_6850:629-1231(-)
MGTYDGAASGRPISAAAALSLSSSSLSRLSADSCSRSSCISSRRRLFPSYMMFWTARPRMSRCSSVAAALRAADAGIGGATGVVGRSTILRCLLSFLILASVSTGCGQQSPKPRPPCCFVVSSSPWMNSRSDLTTASALALASGRPVGFGPRILASKRCGGALCSSSNTPWSVRGRKGSGSMVFPSGCSPGKRPSRWRGA